jgi:hypothetical protein
MHPLIFLKEIIYLLTLLFNQNNHPLFVIQTTVGRKDLGNTKHWKQVDVHEILRYTPFRSG